MRAKWLSVLAAAVFLLSFTFSAGAATLDAAQTGSLTDAAVVAADYEEVGSAVVPDRALPSAYSVRDAGYVTPVRNQKYNTCWAYSSTATLETRLLRLGYASEHLSAMHMNYWGVTHEDGTGWNRTETAAGYPYIALGYLTSFGAVPDALFPDSMSMEDYRSYGARLYPTVSVDSVIYFDPSDRDSVKAVIYRYGAVIGNFNYLSAYESADASSYLCDTEGFATHQLNGHAVEIVGWDDSYSASNFHPQHRPLNDGAWLCKNSWGTGYGQDGYFWISYEDRYLFDARFGPSYSLIGVTGMSAIDRIHQAETYGATYEFSYVQQFKPRMSKITYANVFDFSDGYHNIDKVTFETTSQGSDYTVYYIPLEDSGVPTSDMSRWTELGAGTVEYEGYICAELDDFDAPLQRAAIGIQLSKTALSGEDYIGIGVSEWLTSGGNYLFRPDAKRGDSYLLGFDVEAVDVMDFYQDYLEDDIGGSFVIKALCYSDEVIGDADHSGGFDIIDVTMTQRHIIGLDRLDERGLRFADFDNDGVVSAIDCTEMQRAVLKMANPQILARH